VPRIYVASLTDYNAGNGHGAWIDAAQEKDELWAEINAMLKASPEARAFPQGGPAEEWAIHDYEGFGELRLSEYEDIERVSKVALAIEEHGDAMAAWLSLSDDNEPDEFEEHYRGQWDTEEEFTQQQIMEIGWSNVPAYVYLKPYAAPEDHVNVFDELSSYIDWESVTRDFVQHGNYTSVDDKSGGYFMFEDEV
jgi:antirestriction protein